MNVIKGLFTRGQEVLSQVWESVKAQTKDGKTVSQGKTPVSGIGNMLQNLRNRIKALTVRSHKERVLAKQTPASSLHQSPQDQALQNELFKILATRVQTSHIEEKHAEEGQTPPTTDHPSKQSTRAVTSQRFDMGELKEAAAKSLAKRCHKEEQSRTVSENPAPTTMAKAPKEEAKPEASTLDPAASEAPKEELDANTKLGIQRNLEKLRSGDLNEWAKAVVVAVCRDGLKVGDIFSFEKNGEFKLCNLSDEQIAALNCAFSQRTEKTEEKTELPLEVEALKAFLAMRKPDLETEARYNLLCDFETKMLEGLKEFLNYSPKKQPLTSKEQEEFKKEIKQFFDTNKKFLAATSTEPKKKLKISLMTKKKRLENEKKRLENEKENEEKRLPLIKELDALFDKYGHSSLTIKEQLQYSDLLKNLKYGLEVSDEEIDKAAKTLYRLTELSPEGKQFLERVYDPITTVKKLADELGIGVNEGENKNQSVKSIEDLMHNAIGISFQDWPRFSMPLEEVKKGKLVFKAAAEFGKVIREKITFWNSINAIRDAKPESFENPYDWKTMDQNTLTQFMKDKGIPLPESLQAEK